MTLPPILPGDPNPTGSIVVQRMKQFKDDLVARDADTILQLGQRWARLEGALEANIQLLVLELQELQAAGLAFNIQDVYRLNRYQKLLAQMQVEMTYYNLWVAEYVVENQRKMAVLGINNATELIQLSLLEGGLGAGAFFDKLPVEAIELMIGNAGKGGPVYALLQEAYPLAVDQMTDALIRNVALGLGPRVTAEQMMNGVAGGLNHALTVARTEQLRVYREASRQQYEISGAVQKYMRFASKSGNTCALCLALDREIYLSKDLMYVHPNDRCTMIPIVNGVKPPGWESGEDWLKRQDPELQQKILGKKAQELWSNGDIELMDLVKKTEHDIWGPSLQRRNLDDLQKIQLHVKAGGPAGLLSDNISYRTSKASVHFDQAIEDIDSVFINHEAMTDIKVSGMTGRAEGKYYPDTRKIQINNSATYPEFSFIHETGHAHDFLVLPDVIGSDAITGTIGSAFGSTPMDDFWDAIDNSEAIKKLKRLKGSDPGAMEYLLDVREIYARSYSQYVVEKSGSKLLKKQLADTLEFDFYPEQWTAKDFAPIKKALDKLYRDAGLLH